MKAWGVWAADLKPGLDHSAAARVWTSAM